MREGMGIGARIPKEELGDAPRMMTGEFLRSKNEDELRAMARGKVEQAVADAVALGMTIDEKQKINLADQLTGYYKTLLEQVRDGQMDESDMNIAILDKINEKISSFVPKKDINGAPIDIAAKAAAHMEQLKAGGTPNQTPYTGEPIDLDARRQAYMEQLKKGTDTSNQEDVA